VIDEVSTLRQQSKTSCVAYIYFDYKIREAQTGNYVVRTILKQLLCALDAIPHDIEAVYDESSSRLKRPEKPFLIQQLLSAAAKFSTVYVMMDGLDECTKETLEDTITLIRQFKDSTIKVFSTFRPILINLGDQLDIPVIHSIRGHEEDIKNYLSTRLDKEWLHNTLLLPQIIDRLPEGADGK
jgi:hypothetical protein